MTGIWTIRLWRGRIGRKVDFFCYIEELDTAFNPQAVEMEGLDVARVTRVMVRRMETDDRLEIKCHLGE